MTGRGFKPERRKVPGSVPGTVHGFKEELPRPNMSTLMNQNPNSLNSDLRFFEDTKKRLNKTVVYTQ